MSLESQILLLSLLIPVFIRFCEGVCSEGPYFDKFPFRKFELLGNVIQTIFVEDEIQCILNCSRLPECLSLNIAVKPKQDGLFECILFRELAIPSSVLIVLSQIYHYYIRRFGQGMCAIPRCKNGGTCLTMVNDYRCLCQQRFTGKQCENLTCDSIFALGMEDGSIPDQQLSASSVFSGGYLVPYGRLNNQGGAWASSTKDASQWFRVDIGTVAKVTGIATQGSTSLEEWVTSYSLQYSEDNSIYVDYKQGKTFSGNSDQNTVVKNDVNPAIIARYIGVRPKTWFGHIVLRMELYGCK